MNLLAALLIAENVRQRAEQGDCPTIPAQRTETLEEVVLELQRTIAADLVDRQFVPVLEALRLAHSHLDMPALLISHNKDAKKIEAVMIDIAAK